MRSTRCWVILLGVFVVQHSFAVPVSNVPASDNDLTNSIENGEDEEDEEDDSLVLEDDFTTHGLERLSSAATCLVAGVEYTHGQQIYRKDPCEFCLCLDGEMFCWWQDCPPTMEGPCRDRGPFSPCLSIPANPLAFGSSSLLSTSLLSALSSESSPSVTELTTKKNVISTSSSLQTTQSSVATDKIIDTTNRPPESTSTGKNVCVVMGKEYQIGDKLPHDTGNCLECICGQGAKVTCSPHQCAPVEDDMNDYHLSGARQQVIPDIF